METTGSANCNHHFCQTDTAGHPMCCRCGWILHTTTTITILKP
jgi:hypothetical protein